MTPFRFHSDFTNNKTIEGSLSFVDTYEEFIEDCYEKDLTSKWILITKFRSRITNHMLHDIKIAHNEDVLALIICTNLKVESDFVFKSPGFISIIHEDQASYESLFKLNERT